MKFDKYQAIGNDYLVISGSSKSIAPEIVQRLCDRHFGVGSDGVLFGPLLSDEADFRLRIFNPDASEAEKSGNGLRIFCRYLWDNGFVKKEKFTIETSGGIVHAEILDLGRLVRISMGIVSFSSQAIPVTGRHRDVLMEKIDVNGASFKFCAASIGNPHCVIPVDTVTPVLAQRYGSIIENHPNFPNSTNVQFMQVLDRQNIRIEIWERGAGYTLASGTSSCAAAAVALRLGLCDRTIDVHMPGGTISITIDRDFGVSMTGPVVHICSGEVSEECFV